MGDDLKFEGNDQDAIEVLSSLNTNSTVLVRNGTIPGYAYNVQTNMEINAGVTIAAGATFTMKQDSKVEVAGSESFLAMQGTEEAPIVFGSANGQPGDWRGISYGNSTSASNQISYLTLADAGGKAYSVVSSHRGGLFVVGDNATLNIKNSTFRNNSFAALSIASDSTRVVVESSHFENNEEPIRTHANTIAQLSEDLSFEGNDPQAIVVKNGSGYSAIAVTEDAIWPAFAVPVQMETQTDVEALLTLSPGLRIRYAKDVGLLISETGKLAADATDADPIIMEGLEDVTGYWKGVHFEGSLSNDNKLINVQLINPGSARWDVTYPSQTGLYLTSSARVFVEDVTISGSGHHGITVNRSTLVGCSGLSISESVDTDFYGITGVDECEAL
ncbi:hypothetical protein [Lujinxingia litoralis]|nr:hypothetical protein [Lujinxingia litoralis]